MAAIKNILFIMFDQLRFDYLSCYGHQTLHTPHIDALAQKGVRFTNCYVQAPVCGPSRMSTYTGRYVNSHGSSYNNIPLNVGEITLGDHLRQHGMDCVLIGKTHMEMDVEGMKRLGLLPESVIGARVSEAGFDAYIRDDGLWAVGPNGAYDAKRSPYNEYLKQQGYQGDNPWADYANAGIDDDGDIASGWFMRHAAKPANIKEQDSETPWLTSQAIEFMQARQKNDTPFLCHLSFIKPHWPYIVPAPYHNMYRPQDVQPLMRDEHERAKPHPIYQAFMEGSIAQTFSKDEVRDVVIPAYMGLIKQCDDQMGRLFEYLEQSGQMEETMIIVTSDHGDYLGDHYLGEKDMFHDVSVKVPLIIYDPSAHANKMRGKICDELVEAIDLTATFVAIAKQKNDEFPSHILEGRSLLPLLHGEKVKDWRKYAISEYDYAMQDMVTSLGVATKDARLFMVADKDYKMIHAEGGFRPMLFDLNNDPNEYHDIGDDAAYQHVIDRMYGYLFEWTRRLSQRITVSDNQIADMREFGGGQGVMIGVWIEDEVPENHADFYKGKAKQDFTIE